MGVASPVEKAQDSACVTQASSTPAHREVQSLDGLWTICFDSENQGRAASWHKREVFETLIGSQREIQVPSCWEEVEQDYEGLAYYGRTFRLEQEWSGKQVQLCFGAVNYQAEVWLNDCCLGRHEGGYGPFSFEVGDLLEAEEENFLLLRVLGPIVAEDKVIDGLGRNDMPHWRGALAAGIWQSVELVATGSVRVDDAFVIPRLEDDSIAVELALFNAELESQAVDLEIEVLEVGSAEVRAAKPLRLNLVPGLSQADCELAIPQARYWSPASPALYELRVKVRVADSLVDVSQTRFGMRELTIREGRLELNGESIYIKAAFFEGLYPTKLANPDNLEMARREILLAKEAGFNMIRPWRKPPPPAWLDLCDELGVLVIGGLPIECMDQWPTVTPQLPERIENEVRSAILRDRNRACIVQWEIFNEIWRRELKRLKHAMSMLARKLDPSRMILDESGGFADGANLYLPGQCEPEKFNDVHVYPGAPYGPYAYKNMLALSKTDEEKRAMGLDPKVYKNEHSKPGLLTIVSEIGYGSPPNLEDNNRRFEAAGNPRLPAYRYHRMLEDSFREVLKESGVDAIFPTVDAFCEAQQAIHSEGNRRMIESIRCNASVGGYCVHALTDGDWILGAGLLDLFRRPKGCYYGTKAANAARYLAIQPSQRNLYAGRDGEIRITAINDLEAVSGTLSLLLRDANGEAVLEESRAATLQAGISVLLDLPLKTAALSGHYTVVVRFQSEDGQLQLENQEGLDVFAIESLEPLASVVAVIDPDDVLGPYLREQGLQVESFGAETAAQTPVLVACSKAETEGLGAAFNALSAFVERGGTAVYLEAIDSPRGSAWWQGKELSESVLALEHKRKHGLGLWIGVAHVVREHPIFDGLPSEQLMGQLYENVWAPQSIQISGAKPIVATISHGYHSEDTFNQHHLGPEPAWHASDLCEVKHGQGRYILSTLRLLENLGEDPVADRIIRNLIKWLFM